MTLGTFTNSASMMRAAGLLILFALVLQTFVGSAHSQAVPERKPQQNTPLVELGIGDEVRFQVYGQNDMDSTLTIDDDGTVTVPLAGQVKVVGLSPSEAADRIEKALRDGNFLVSPNVTLTVTQARSQRVSVLGAVGVPGRYVIDSSTTIFDLLAQAGGITNEGAATIFVLRQDENGAVNRYPIDMRGFSSEKVELPFNSLKGGDSVFVPKAEQFYIFGEVARPGVYTIDPEMNLLQAIAKAGGVSQRGSMNRVEIKRREAQNKFKTFSADLDDAVKADDVIRVKESLF